MGSYKKIRVGDLTYDMDNREIISGDGELASLLRVYILLYKK
jgi:hypothetical protein